ncbi:hypothetical protein CPLU01_08054 [Colletotrichum plurivorum]|uniref:Uncharacterized protein n=1 Tax=Colletotrichum plurivorum TaxID=2175906 RepID=A0A8H6KDU8_9PEZI|nr:hypothetical protein CPLU01_08054 [Colletotrichum plurivorum]
MMDDEELRLWEGIMNDVFTTDGFSEFRDGPTLVRSIRASRVLRIEDIVEMSCFRAGRKTVHVYHSPAQADDARALAQCNTRIHGIIFIEPGCVSIISRQRLVQLLEGGEAPCMWMQRQGPLMSSEDMPVGGLTEHEILMLRCSLDANDGVIRRPEIKDFRIPESDEFHDDAIQHTDVEDWVQAVDVADSLEESLESLDSLASVYMRGIPSPLASDDGNSVSYSSEAWVQAVDDLADSLEDSEYIVYTPSESTRLTCDGDSLVFYPTSRHYPQKDHQVHPDSPIANADHRDAQADEDQEASERSHGGDAEEQPPTLLQQNPSAPCEPQSHSQASKLSERSRETGGKPSEAKADDTKIVNADLTQTSSEIRHTKDQVLEKSNTDPKARLNVKDVPGQYRPKTYKYNSTEELIAGYEVNWGREEAINIPEQTDMDIRTRLEKMESLWHDHCKKDEGNNAAFQEWLAKKRLATLESLGGDLLIKAMNQKLTSLNKQLDAFHKDRAAKKTMLRGPPEGQARLVENAKTAELEHKEKKSLEARLKALEEDHQKLRTEHSSLSATVVDQQETIAAMEHRIEKLEGLLASDSEDGSDDEDSEEDSDYHPSDHSDDCSDEYSNDDSYDDSDGHYDDHFDDHFDDHYDEGSGRDPGVFTGRVHVLGSDNICHVCAAQHQFLDRDQW